MSHHKYFESATVCHNVKHVRKFIIGNIFDSVKGNAMFFGVQYSCIMTLITFKQSQVQ